MRLSNKTVWITGASSGIGLELAKQAVQAGAAVVLSSRNPEKLDAAAQACRALLPSLPGLESRPSPGERVWVLPLDVTQPHEIQTAVDFIVKNGLRVDILVNNAGVGQASLAVETPAEVERQIMEVNYWGCVNLAKAVLPLMKGWGGGQIAVTSSVLGLFAIPKHSSYVSSKHALQGYFASLALEWYHQGVGITLLCPGRIATPFALSSLRPGQNVDQASLAQRSLLGISSECCARLCWRAILRKKNQVVVARLEWVPLLLQRYLPGLFMRLLCWAMSNPKLRKKIISF